MATSLRYRAGQVLLNWLSRNEDGLPPGPDDNAQENLEDSFSRKFEGVFFMRTIGLLSSLLIVGLELKLFNTWVVAQFLGSLLTIIGGLWWSNVSLGGARTIYNICPTSNKGVFGERGIQYDVGTRRMVNKVWSYPYLVAGIISLAFAAVSAVH